MKKISSLAIALMLLLSVLLLPLSVSAEGESEASGTPATTASTAPLDPNKLNISVGTATAKQGDLVEIPVTIETNPGVWGMNLDVHYDEKIMVLRRVTFSEEFKKSMTCLEVDNLDDTKDSNYNIPFGLYAEGQSLTANVTTTGLFCTMTFLVIPGAELGDTLVNITYKPNNVIDVNSNNVKTSIPQDMGVVTVTEGKPAEPGVTYFPSRTRKSTTAPKGDGSLSSTQLILVLVGVVLVVGVVLAILVVRKPENKGEKPVVATPAKPETAAKVKDAAESQDDGIDDQA